MATLTAPLEGLTGRIKLSCIIAKSYPVSDPFGGRGGYRVENNLEGVESAVCNSYKFDNKTISCRELILAPTTSGASQAAERCSAVQEARTAGEREWLALLQSFENLSTHCSRTPQTQRQHSVNPSRSARANPRQNNLPPKFNLSIFNTTKT